MLYDFANCSGLNLIFGLNALLRTADLQWNSSNAQLLLDYCSSKSYNISWELGNGKHSWNISFVKTFPIGIVGFLFVSICGVPFIISSIARSSIAWAYSYKCHFLELDRAKNSCLYSRVYCLSHLMWHLRWGQLVQLAAFLTPRIPTSFMFNKLCWAQLCGGHLLYSSLPVCVSEPAHLNYHDIVQVV